MQAVGFKQVWNLEEIAAAGTTELSKSMPSTTLRYRHGRVPWRGHDMMLHVLKVSDRGALLMLGALNAVFGAPGAAALQDDADDDRSGAHEEIS